MTRSMPKGPQRIVCLTEEPTEILYALGEGHRVVGISAYTVRPPEAQRDKKVVSAFLDGSLPKIQALEPDLVIGFSDIQAKLAAKLISAHLPVLIFNQRTIQEILDVIVQIGSLVGKRAEAQALVSDYLRRIDVISERYASMDSKPRVYFEEWYDPMITGIHWVHELIEIAGGQNVFEEKCREKGAMDRVVTVEDDVGHNLPKLLLDDANPANPDSRLLRMDMLLADFYSRPAVCNPAPDYIILQPMWR